MMTYSDTPLEKRTVVKLYTLRWAYRKYPVLNGWMQLETSVDFKMNDRTEVHHKSENDDNCCSSKIKRQKYKPH